MAFLRALSDLFEILEGADVGRDDARAGFPRSVRIATSVSPTGRYSFDRPFIDIEFGRGGGGVCATKSHSALFDGRHDSKTSAEYPPTGWAA